ncbi:MAG: hypothetical protein AB7P56_05875 [Nitrososphaeraceae archaeon]
MTSKENKKYKRKDPMSSEQIKSQTTVLKRDSDTDIVEGGYWH